MSGALYVFWLYLALATGGASGYPMDLSSTPDGHVTCAFAVQDRAGFVGIGCSAVPADMVLEYECRAGELRSSELADCARLAAIPTRTIGFMLYLASVEELR